MKTLIQICCLALMVAVALPCRAQSPQSPAGALETGPVQISFQLEDGYLIVVKGRIGPLDNLNFVLDSGSSHTVLDRKVARKVGHSALRRAVFHLDKTLSAEWVRVADLQLGPVHVPSSYFPTADLSRESFPIRVDAIVGLDILSFTALHIDYERGTILLQAAGVPDTSNWEPKMAAVPITVQGQRLHVLLDTGAKGLVLYKSQVAGRVRMAAKGSTTWSTVAGEVRVQEAGVPDASIGSLPLQENCFLIDSSRVPPGVDGYLGISSLHVKRVDFDFAKGVFHWEK